ncbi:MAG TPA: winged helix DNA-binding domain-containing protein [Acidimicrobiales bacterium]|nr:winged helix DNA-binding domain-containing protein [Acidimicrobiales bacterium]
MTRLPVLGQRALNRALLGRQHLLRRAAMPAVEMIEHLVGLQAQAPLAPYVGLWSRLGGFDADELAGLATSRQVVRASLMRNTVHLVSAPDCLAIRPLVQPVVSQGFAGHFGRAMGGVDVEAVVAAGRELLEQESRTRAQLRELLGARWPDTDADALAYAVSHLVPAAHVTPRGVWGRTGPAALTTIESWLGRPLEPRPSIDELVRRYLRAFGPATVMDVQAWCGLTRLREVVERVGLRAYVDAAGHDLYDVADGPLPDPETPAPVRFLPEYDNVLLSHADRTRVIPDGRPVPLPPGNGASAGTVLVDGVFAATWRVRRQRRSAALTVEPFAGLSTAAHAELVDEGGRLLSFVAPDAEAGDVRVVAAA